VFEAVDAVSELRSAIDELRAEVLTELPDARIEEDFGELQRAVDLLEAERLRRLAEIDRRRLFERDGHLSAATWLARVFRMGWGAAKDSVRLARALEDMPGTREALEDGDVPMSAVRVLVGAREGDPDAFAEAEADLVTAARIHASGDLRRVAAYWRQAVEDRRYDAGGERTYANRRLHASVTLLGMVRVDGDLDPETGETLLTALRAVLDAETRSGDGAPSHGRTAAQRRADALGEICRQWLDSTGRPTVAGERPHLTVTVPIEALAGMTAAHPSVAREPGPRPTAAMDHVGPVPSGTARRVACDASIRRVVLSARSEPLDVGRRTPVVPPAMRRAVVLRDGACRFPGCDRPHTWCDAHHVVHWADGGRTALPNLLLLCRRHHRLVHRPDGFRLGLEHGRAVFRRPDGSMLEERAPP
jgi:hypothetical protein